MTIHCTALIPARGGSKTIPRKNIRLLAGKPLIAYTIEAALASLNLERVIVTTDDEEIASVAREYGAEVPFMRPSELAQDTSNGMDAIIHAIEWLKAHEGAVSEYIMALQPTSPLRITADIDAALRMLDGEQVRSVISVCATEHHPYLTKAIREDGTLTDFITGDLAYLRRQDLPPAYGLNGAVYVSSASDILAERTFLTSRTHAYVMPPERSIDVDTFWDFYLTELILKNPYHAQNHSD